MKKKGLVVILILFLSLIYTINALEITTNFPINNHIFSMNTSDSGIYIPVNITTDEDANCSVLPGFCYSNGGMIGVCLYFYPVALLTNNTRDHFNDIWIANNNKTDYKLIFICNDTNNSVFEKSVFFSINYSCTSNLINTSWSNWEAYQCSPNNWGNQSRHKTQYDSEDCGIIANQTFYEYRKIPCDYCFQNITGPFYNGWSECDKYGIKHRNGYYIDLNFQSCCNITNLQEDCEIKNKFKNFTDDEDCDFSLNLFVNKPLKYIYESRRIDFDINSTLKLEFLEFIDFFDEDNNWNTLCRDCQIYKATKTFLDGKHNLTIRGRNDGKEGFAFASFLVDTKNPTLHSISPKGNRFTNGSDFYVKYTEENCKSILLEIFGFGGIGNKITIREPCTSGRDNTEDFYLNLSDFDNQEISYQFAIYDATDKKTRSKFIKVKVDTTLPVLNNLDSFFEQSGKNVYFTFNVTENNFDKITYSYTDSRGKLKEKILCNRLKNGICETKKSFSKGDWSIDIQITDEAGNAVGSHLDFEVDY